MKGLEFAISELNRKYLVAEHFPSGTYRFGSHFPACCLRG